MRSPEDRPICWVPALLFIYMRFTFNGRESSSDHFNQIVYSQAYGTLTDIQVSAMR